MRSTENLSGGRDANIHATISRPLPTSGRPGTRSVPAELKPAPDKKGGRHTVRNIALVVGTPVIAAGVVAAGVAAGQHHFEKNEPISIPGIARDAAAIPDKVADWFTSKNEVPLTFDNNAVEGVIGPNNIVKIPQAEIDRLFPTPFEKIGDHSTIQILYPIDISTSTNPDRQIEYKRSSNEGNTPESDVILEEKGFYNIFETLNVPPGSILKAPLDGMLSVSTSSGTSPVNDHDYGGASIIFKTEDGKTFALAISGGLRKGGDDVFKSLTTAPAIGWKMSVEERKALGNKRIPIKRGDPILQVANEAMIAFFITSQDIPDISQGKEIINADGTKSILVPNPPPTNLELIATPKGEILTPGK